MKDDDRTVHGITPTGGEIVRYDRAGKWYVEGESDGPFRRRVSLQAAAFLAARGAHLPGRPGGSAFDRLVRIADSRP